jgi:general secretion pathway protein G
MSLSENSILDIQYSKAKAGLCYGARQKARWTRMRYRNPAVTQSGFTLIEMMVVVAIIGILAALLVPKLMSRPDEARNIAARQDIATLKQALDLYRLDNGRYPTTGQGLSALVKKPTIAPVPRNWKGGGYLEKLPSDPWGNPYQYLNPGVHGEIDIFSYGSQGPDGSGDSRTIVGSWQ